MDFFKNKVVWITGASSGMGRALADLLFSFNANLVLSAREDGNMSELVSFYGPHFNKVLLLPFDLSQAFDANEMVQTILTKFGRIDYLINNGGISQRSFSYETPIENDRKIMEINYFSAIILTKAVLPIMIKQGSGHITATSSLVGKFGFPLRSAYSASKHALIGYFESVALETFDYNIKVSILIPGRVLTNISKHAIDKQGNEHGKLDDGQANGLSSEKAALVIAKGLKKQKRVILIGKSELFMLPIKRFFPRLHFYLARKIKST